MSITTNFVAEAILIGVGATAILDLWSMLAARLFGLPSPKYRLVGRWLGAMPRGRFVHASIAQAPPIPHEMAIGWIAHYLIGIVFAGCLLLIWGEDWGRQPTLAPVLMVGIGSVAAPFLIMQPGMG